MQCEDAQELITGLVDNELTGQERSSIEDHLRDCPRCQSIYAQEQVLKKEIHRAGGGITVPDELRRRLLSDPRIYPDASEEAPWWRGAVWPRLAPLRPALVVSVLLLLLIPTVYLMRPKAEPVSLASLRTHEQILTGVASFARVGSEEALKELLSRSANGRFSPMGYDLSMIGLRASGGFTQEVHGRKILVSVYEGSGGSLTCFTFLGTEKDAPAGAALFFDTEKKMNFYTFSRGRINGVLHREGDLICILVSEMPMQDLLALARSKARPS